MSSYFRCWWSFTSFYNRAASHQLICHFITEPVLKNLSFHMICGLKPLKMFWIVLFCLCFWRLDGDADAVKSVMEGDSVTLHTRHGKMMDNDRIQWWFKNKNTLIAEINVTANSVTVNNNYDRRFRGRLKVDRQTRCLTITNIRTGHAGLYGVQTNRMRKTFTVIVNARLPVLVISSNSSQCSSLSTGFNPNSSQTPHLNISELCHTFRYVSTDIEMMDYIDIWIMGWDDTRLHPNSLVYNTAALAEADDKSLKMCIFCNICCYALLMLGCTTSS
uniref:Uncharacterized protein n=1 Tax=Cyprinus carpio TaxID=7962 RepID=A0A8C1L7N6_CYPCA